jgi:protein-disulfide isomerase
MRRALAIVVCVAALLGCATLASCGAALPPVVRDELARAPRGAITVLYFTDFQCPFCRRTHAALAPLVAASQGRVRLVLRHVPLPMHPDARPAARAAVCAESLAARDELVSALVNAADLGEQACEALAVARGAEREAWRRCVAASATEARIDRDVAMFDELRGDGVPLLYVGEARLEGEQTRATLEAALDEAARSSGVSWR